MAKAQADEAKNNAKENTKEKDRQKMNTAARRCTRVPNKCRECSVRGTCHKDTSIGTQEKKFASVPKYLIRTPWTGITVSRTAAGRQIAPAIQRTRITNP